MTANSTIPARATASAALLAVGRDAAHRVACIAVLLFAAAVLAVAFGQNSRRILALAFAAALFTAALALPLWMLPRSRAIRGHDGRGVMLLSTVLMAALALLMLCAPLRNGLAHIGQSLIVALNNPGEPI